MRKKQVRGQVVLAVLAAALCMALVLHMVAVLAQADTQAAATVSVDDDFDLTSCVSEGLTWQTGCFNGLQDGLNAASAGGRSMYTMATTPSRLSSTGRM